MPIDKKSSLSRQIFVQNKKTDLHHLPTHDRMGKQTISCYYPFKVLPADLRVPIPPPPHTHSWIRFDQRDNRGLTRVLTPMPSLRDKSHGGVLCTFSSRTLATAAVFARSSPLSSSRPGQAVWSLRENGMDPPSHTAGSLSSSQPGGSPCWVSSLVFGLIGYRPGATANGKKIIRISHWLQVADM
jgi:hypothetical protein